MARRDIPALAIAMLVAPLAVHTAYLLWLWPWPPGASLVAELGPYFLSLLAGLPFAVAIARRRGRFWPAAAYLAVGFVVLWVYSLGVLCGVRDVCV